MADHRDYLEMAVRVALEHVREGGGPFGAVVVQHGRVVARGWNQVTATFDPTAHAEISAIRKAGQSLGRFDLRGCLLYSSCEPCPMCLAAAYWARLDAVWYASGREEAAAAGFDDALIYRELSLAPDRRRLPVQQLEVPSVHLPFREWLADPGRIPY